MFWLNRLLTSVFTYQVMTVVLIILVFGIPILLSWFVIQLLIRHFFKLQLSRIQIFELALFISLGSLLLFFGFGLSGLFGLVYITPLGEFFTRLYSSALFNFGELLFFGMLPFAYVFNYFVFTLFPLYSLVYLLLKKDIQKQKKYSAALTSFILTLVGSMIACVTFFGLLIGVIFLDEGRCYRERDIFFEFNGHIHSLCNERTDTSECPRNEEELMAFNKHTYSQLQACAKTAYDFNEATQTATWILRWYDDTVFISHPRFFPGFGYYYRFKSFYAFGEGWSDSLYPPQFEGPWEIIK